jgi:hypothetical protein
MFGRAASSELVWAGLVVALAATACDGDDAPFDSWNTFYGATSSHDFGAAVAVDRAGSSFTAGYAQGPWDGPDGEPPLDAYDPSSGNPEDAFVLALSADGAYLWHAFLGGAADDAAFGVALGADGSVSVAGLSDATWDGPGGESPLAPHSASGKDLFVEKLGADGSYQWHTFYGCGDDTWGSAVAVAADGEIVVAGSSSASFDGPDGEPPLHAHGGGDGCSVSSSRCADAFVLRLGPDGEHVWHTFYGAAGADDFCQAIAVDSDGDALATGFSLDAWDGPDGAAPLAAHSSDDDAFVLKLAPDGSYAWHTFFGGAYHDGGYAISMTPDGRAVVSGKSRSAWAGPQGEAPLHAFTPGASCDTDGCAADAYLLELTCDGAYVWHTFYGSDQEDVLSSHAVDAQGNIFATGFAMGAWDGPGGEQPVSPYSPDANAEQTLVVSLDADGAYRWHGFYGFDDSLGLALSPDGHLT